MNFKSVLAVLAVMNSAPVKAQTLSLEDLAAQVDKRAADLRGYEEFLRDPDPVRATAAFQVMMESGDENLVRLALNIGVYSPDPMIRQTALAAFFAGAPTIDLFFDGTGMVKEDAGDFRIWVQGLGGAAGAGDTGSASFAVGAWSDAAGCYVNRNDSDRCLVRVNTTTVSVFLDNRNNYSADQWVNLVLTDDGKLKGSLIGQEARKSVGPLEVTMILAE